MLDRLIGRRPIRAWAIKQIDDAVMHLCGQGILESGQKPRKVREALSAGRFEGGIRIVDTGIVINTCRLAAVVPIDALRLLDGGNAAEWQGLHWSVSHVPQRAWAFDGPLVAEPNPAGGSPALVSREDVSHIQRNVRQDAAPPGKVAFRPMDALEDPNRDLDAAIEEAQRRRREAHKGWREDGS